MDITWIDNILQSEESQDMKIKKLEALLAQHSGGFSWKLHNELRHLYAALDEQKALEHCDIILRHSCMDDYILSILSEWQIGKDTQRAIVNLEQWATRYPEMPCMQAACWIKAGDLYQEMKDTASSVSCYEKIMKNKQDVPQPYQQLVKMRLHRLIKGILNLSRVQRFSLNGASAYRALMN